MWKKFKVFEKFKKWKAKVEKQTRQGYVFAKHQGRWILEPKIHRVLQVKGYCVTFYSEEESTIEWHIEKNELDYHGEHKMHET